MEPTMQQDLLKKQAEAEELAVERAIEEKGRISYIPKRMPYMWGQDNKQKI